MRQFCYAPRMSTLVRIEIAMVTGLVLVGLAWYQCPLESAGYSSLGQYFATKTASRPAK